MKIVYILWGLSEVIISRIYRARATDQQNEDRYSLAIIWIVIIMAIVVAVYTSSHFPAPLSATNGIAFIGLGILILGIILRFLVIVSLGRFFTTNVTIRQNHKLKTDGFYKYIRHPAYAASLLSFVGFGISLNNWIALAVVIVAVGLAFYNRIRIEEKLLIKHFGQEYIAYMKNTRRLVPFIF